MNARTEFRSGRAFATLGCLLLLIAFGSYSLRAAVAPDTAAGPVIELPPMIVEGSPTGPPWLYAKTGSSEFLSRCSTATTREFVETGERLAQLLEVLVPAAFLVKMDMPTVTILDQTPSRQINSDAVLQDMMKKVPDQPRSAGVEEVDRIQRMTDSIRGGGNLADPMRNRTGSTRVHFLPNLRIEDRDMTALFAYLDDANFDGSRLTLSPDHVRFMLQRRTPMLPPWLIEGITAIYAQVNLAVDPIVLRPFEWLSAAETRALTVEPERPRPLLSMTDLFAAGAWQGTAEDAWRLGVWRAQATLFVRWSLDPRNAGAREAFWKFAERAGESGESEEIFEACFGFGFAEMRDRLSDYLPLAVKEPVRLPRGQLPRIPRAEVVKATPAQIVRLRGEWERIEIPYVRVRHPEFTNRYADHARRTLRRAAERSESDPRIAAALGLCEVDAGNDTAARPFLETAVNGKVLRPRVYHELARLRLLELTTGQPATRRYSEAEMSPVIALLRTGIRQAPPLPESYALLAEAWLRCSSPPPAEDFAALAQGADLFSWHPLLSHRVALLQISRGRPAEAARLLAQAMERTTDPAIRDRLVGLQAMIGGAKTP